MLFLFAFRPVGLQRVNKFTLGGACAKHGHPLRGLHGEASSSFTTCGTAAPSVWTTDHDQRVAALCLAPRCSTSQTLPCAWAHFQSRLLLHTSLAPSSISHELNVITLNELSPASWHLKRAHLYSISGLLIWNVIEITFRTACLVNYKHNDMNLIKNVTRNLSQLTRLL